MASKGVEEGREKWTKNMQDKRNSRNTGRERKKLKNANNAKTKERKG